jgi:hypothetical protein
MDYDQEENDKGKGILLSFHQGRMQKGNLHDVASD